MAPLILHNVPDDELYIGDDGVQRPYAMVFPQQDGTAPTTRSRRAAPETGSFGRSTRRSRSKTATPARREDPTIQSADKVFGAWKAQQSQSSQLQSDTTIPRKASNPQLSQDDGGAAAATPQTSLREPTEVILRGFRSPDTQYSALNHYEIIAGRILEDYPRNPPLENRRYKSELWRSSQPLTPEERAKVNRVDSGNHWVKITFDSKEAADSAVWASPQSILGCLVYAEYYRGFGPQVDEAVLEATTASLGDEVPRAWRRSGVGGNRTAGELKESFGARNGGRGRLPREVVADGDGNAEMEEVDASPSSSRTVDTGTASARSEDTVKGFDALWAKQASSPLRQSTINSTSLEKPLDQQPRDSTFCQRIPTARRATILPAEQAFMPQPSYTSRLLSQIPLAKWFSGSMIGNEVPRNPETGDFDWNRASLYWKIVAWLDGAFGLFGGEVVCGDAKDD